MDKKWLLGAIKNSKKPIKAEITDTWESYGVIYRKEVLSSIVSKTSEEDIEIIPGRVTIALAEDSYLLINTFDLR